MLSTGNIPDTKIDRVLAEVTSYAGMRQTNVIADVLRN
jgi:hypothetical protein